MGRLSEAVAALFGRRRTVMVRSELLATVNGMSAAELYRTQPALRAVVSFLADNIAGLPVKCYVRESDTDRRRDTESDLALLISRPSADVTTHELMRAIATDYFIYFSALVVALPDESAPSGWELRHIPWSWVQDVVTTDGFEPSSYVVANPSTGGRAEIPAEDCIRFYGYDPDGTLGASSPVEALRNVLSEQISAWNFRNATWRNGGRVTQYLTRPANARDWSPGARARFIKSWRQKYAGEDGDNTGGTPLLEDGMELKSTQFNAREAQWEEATRLAREDCAAVYHVNPSTVWHAEGQTYASAKDNARALYADTLANPLDMIAQRLNARLVPMLGLDPARNYCEFDMSAKLSASFEEQASVLQSSVGRPWMLVNEARARLNMPAVDGGDELCVPLNVAVGGLAAPNDTDPTVERYNSATPAAKSTQVQRKSRGQPSKPLRDAVSDALAGYFRRQARSVLAALPGGEKSAGDPDWWDSERWDRELADDLEPIFYEGATARGVAAMGDLGFEPEDYVPERTRAYLRKMAEARARSINGATRRAIEAALDGEYDDEAERSTPEGVFGQAEEVRSSSLGTSLATSVASWATMEAVRQAAPKDTPRYSRYKTWVVNSSNPRSSHAAMNGETVPYDEPFSNGAMWPGDDVLDAEEVCNCQCSVDVYIVDR